MKNLSTSHQEILPTANASKFPQKKNIKAKHRLAFAFIACHEIIRNLMPNFDVCKCETLQG